MKLLGRRTSVNVQKVMWTLGELDLSVEQVDLGGQYGGLDTPEYRALNPTGKVPTLIDGDLTLWESNAIVRYLVAAYGKGRLGSASPAEMARADMWMEWVQNGVYADFITVFIHGFRLPPSQRDMALCEAALGRLNESMALVEARVSTQDYMEGAELSMGDIPVGACLYRYYTMEIARPDLPALAAYYDRLCAREAYRSHVMVPYDVLRLPGD